MEVIFTKEETLKLIEEYYRRLEDRIVTASVSVKKGYTGVNNQEACITTITISEKIEIVGIEKDFTETISEEELNTILRALFDLYGLDITSVTLDDGLNSRWEGYGYNEYQVFTPYFNGLKVNVKKKSNPTLAKKPQDN